MVQTFLKMQNWQQKNLFNVKIECSKKGSVNTCKKLRYITEFDFNKKSKHRKLNEEPFLPMMTEMTEIPNTRQRKLARMIHDWFNQVQENNFRFNLGAYSFENLDKVMYTIEAWHLPESTELFRKSLYSKSKRSLPSWLTF